MCPYHEIPYFNISDLVVSCDVFLQKLFGPQMEKNQTIFLVAI